MLSYALLHFLPEPYNLKQSQDSIDNYLATRQWGLISVAFNIFPLRVLCSYGLNKLRHPYRINKIRLACHTLVAPLFSCSAVGDLINALLNRGRFVTALVAFVSGRKGCRRNCLKEH